MILNQVKYSCKPLGSRQPRLPPITFWGVDQAPIYLYLVDFDHVGVVGQDLDYFVLGVVKDHVLQFLKKVKNSNLTKSS